jgi:hypothetical protein
MDHVDTTADQLHNLLVNCILPIDWLRDHFPDQTFCIAHYFTFSLASSFSVPIQPSFDSSLTIFSLARTALPYLLQQEILRHLCRVPIKSPLGMVADCAKHPIPLTCHHHEAFPVSLFPPAQSCLSIRACFWCRMSLPVTRLSDKFVQLDDLSYLTSLHQT